MSRTVEITHEERDTHDLPKRMQRYRVRVSAVTDNLTEPSPLADQWDDDSADYVPLQHEVRISVDPTEFLGYVTVTEILEHDREYGTLTDAEGADRATLLERLNAVDTLDVQDLLDEVFDAIRDGRNRDALDAIDRWGTPKWSTLDESKAAYDAAMKDA